MRYESVSLHNLSIFCDVARHRSFSRAGEVNEVTQSAASQVIHRLEERLGVQLVNRATRPLQLTPAGRSYFEGCQRLIEQYVELESSLRETDAELALNVQVAAIYSVGLGDMGQYVERFKEILPGARVHVEYLHPDRVCEKVLEGAADFGLVSFPRKGRLLTALPWREEEMVLACAPGHPLAQYKSIRPAQLEGEKFVGFDRNLVIRREVDKFLREQGVAVDVVLEFDNIENIKKAAEIAAGVALLPLPTLHHEVQAGTLAAIPLSGNRLVRPLGIIHHRHHHLGAAALRFVELLRQPLAAEDCRKNGRCHSAGERNGNDASPSSPRGRDGTARASRKKSQMTPV